MNQPVKNSGLLTSGSSGYCFQFHAMASACELLFDCRQASLCQELGELAQQEVRRIEHKFSRFREDNIVYLINHSQAKPVTVDNETARLLNYAASCFQLSDGLFDITSGVLRKLWRFDQPQLPDPKLVEQLLQQVGFDKLDWQPPVLMLQPGMQLDFGGIGKEYAADRCSELLAKKHDGSVLVNFGGDIRVTRPKADGTDWQIGIENPYHPGEYRQVIHLIQGAVATSGDNRQSFVVDGTRYGHILNPKTGWPVQGAPRSVTVLGQQCVEAGFLATLAMLNGNDAEAFLKQQNVDHVCIR